ncbi:hypothetical protein THAOC_18539 [Thalassiosira oceanica]|uniref:Uncharacterized protein n=1 Tax=Thalassiosira oceanica TaxID=159749 RepID=K0SJ39_THAOC|nr:hypothetical protein THAOC_18539 [Thalassiosira oceanica]|eukprot:EJK61031.1 hypothetical protein THAOC_18539 [Thalassiosira oceanica]
MFGNGLGVSARSPGWRPLRSPSASVAPADEESLDRSRASPCACRILFEIIPTLRKRSAAPPKIGRAEIVLVDPVIRRVLRPGLDLHRLVEHPGKEKQHKHKCDGRPDERPPLHRPDGYVEGREPGLAPRTLRHVVQVEEEGQDAVARDRPPLRGLALGPAPCIRRGPSSARHLLALATATDNLTLIGAPLEAAHPPAPYELTDLEVADERVERHDPGPVVLGAVDHPGRANYPRLPLPELRVGRPAREERVEAPGLPRGYGRVQPLRGAPDRAVDQLAVSLLLVAGPAAVHDHPAGVADAFAPGGLLRAHGVPVLAPRLGRRALPGYRKDLQPVVEIDGEGVLVVRRGVDESVANSVAGHEEAMAREGAQTYSVAAVDRTRHLTEPSVVEVHVGTIGRVVLYLHGDGRVGRERRITRIIGLVALFGETGETLAVSLAALRLIGRRSPQSHEEERRNTPYGDADNHRRVNNLEDPKKEPSSAENGAKGHRVSHSGKRQRRHPARFRRKDRKSSQECILYVGGFPDGVEPFAPMAKRLASDGCFVGVTCFPGYDFGRYSEPGSNYLRDGYRFDEVVLAVREAASQLFGEYNKTGDEQQSKCKTPGYTLVLHDFGTVVGAMYANQVIADKELSMSKRDHAPDRIVSLMFCWDQLGT